ncbi:MAG: stage 0 sporulation protein [Ruminococcaceae bacterium]|nr:stage 0 sporulation protein [Oscillospiraceae bacterium]
MSEVIGISFRGSGKMYYFAANGNKAKDSDYAIVETARGVEYGRVVMTNKNVSKKELVLPLKNVLRIASAEDHAHFEENKQKEKEAFEICQKKILAHGLDMKLIEAEYTFDNTKLLFYFTSDDRVDFRDLVKDLASSFKTRIELRQIGIRDEAKIMGGLGVCGREFCCHSFLPDFVQVSIKMAKEQNLALNSAKISGACGRLMCCLRYEYDTYQEESRRTPKVDSRVMTPDGSGKVIEAKPLLGLVKIALDENPSEPKIYDRELLRPETDEEYKKALEAQVIRDKKEAERQEAKAQAAARVAEAKEAALARAAERARESAEKKERAAKNAKRQQQRNGEDSRNQQKKGEEMGVKNENSSHHHKNRYGKNRHRHSRAHQNGEKGKNEQ